jgi:endonuclease YncB( thermonuclease family)
MDSFRRPLCIALFGTAVALAALTPVRAGGGFRGPVEAIVLDVLDGDTFVADALVWPGQSVRVNVRIRGIDAPEMKSRCAAEHRAALRARDELARLIGEDSVSISNIGGAKYYGRVLADVETQDGVPVAEEMLGQSLVRAYTGGRRKSWCG